MKTTAKSLRINHDVRRCLTTFERAAKQGILKALLKLVRVRRWALRVLRSIVRPILSDTDWCAALPFSAMTVPQVVAPIALLPATVPVRAAEQPSPASGLRALTSGRQMGHELSPRQVYERNVKFNRAKVMAQASEGLQ